MLNQPSTGITATTTFIVRFWRDWTGSTSRWRGRVEHVQSGQQVSFLKIDDLLGFFERFGIGGEDPPPTQARTVENHLYRTAPHIKEVGNGN